MTRVAQCHCGDVRITCEGEPDPVLMCSCQLCQRRTGSPIHIGAWFSIDDVLIEGETKEFTRTSGDLGAEATFNFCPECGTSIWWADPFGEGSPLNGKIGIAGGCFADRDFPPPTLSFFETRKHPWVSAPEGARCYMDGPPPERFADLLGGNP